MSKYLLLRNNKQAGPYTLDEIRAMALKAYDLVWVEGKSAAWRYPGEIEELKSFAPPVEEQPFDRFFKKPVQEEQSTTSNKQSTVNTTKQPTVEVEKSRYAPVASEQTASAPNKGVYINLPAESKSTEEKDQYDYREKAIPREPVINKETVQKSFSQSIPASGVEAIGTEENFGTPTDQLKKLYAQKEARQKKAQGPNFKHLLKPVGIGFGLIALLAAGIFIGLSINNRGLNSTKNNSAKDQNGVLEQQSSYPARTVTTKSSAPQTDPKTTENSISTIDPGANIPDENALEEKRKLRAAKKRMADSINALKAAPVKPDSTAFMAERDVVKKPAETNNQNESIKSNIEDYVSLSASKFNVGTFGGISDLQLTVSNTSPFALDLVVVEVQYIQSNKKIFKTENLYYHGVAAGAAIMQEAPKSPRGVKVKYRITIISSKSIGISYSEL